MTEEELLIFKLRHKFLNNILGIAKDHAGVLVIEKFVLDPRKTGGHRALDHKHRARLERLNNWHAVDGRGLVMERGGTILIDSDAFYCRGNKDLPKFAFPLYIWQTFFRWFVYRYL